MDDLFTDELTAALDAIVADLPPQAIARVSAADYHPRHHDRRTVTLWGTGGTAATAAAVALAVGVFGPGVPNAFANWSPRTSPPAPDQVVTAEQDCTMQIETMTQSLASTSAAGDANGITWKSVIVDVRGPFTLVAFTATGASTGQASCLTGGSSWPAGPQAMLSISGKGSVSITGSAKGVGGGPANYAIQESGSATIGGNSTPPSSGEVTDPSTNWNSNSNDQVALGQVGAGVTAVTLYLSDGTAVQTTVANGFYAAWWPGSTAVSTVSFTTSAGTFSQTVPEQQPPVHSLPSN